MGIEDTVTTTKNGARIALDVRPGAPRTRVPAGYDPWRRAVTAQVRSPPVKGEANRELLAALAETLDVPVDRLRLVSGATGGRKVVEVHGADARDVASRLRAALDRAGTVVDGAHDR